MVKSAADVRAHKEGRHCVAMAATMVLGQIGESQLPVVAWLVPLDGPHERATFRLQETTTIGSAASSHVVIKDPGVSAEHCRVFLSYPVFKVVDGGSAAGTFLNGERVDEAELVDGDVIVVGSTRLTFKSVS